MLGKFAISILATCIAAVQACDPPNGFMAQDPFTNPPQSSNFAYNQAVDVEWTVPYTGSTVTLLVYYGCPVSTDGTPVNNDHCKGHVDLKGGLPEQNGTYTFTPTCDMLPQGGATDTYGLFLINENPCWISWLMFTMSGGCDGTGFTSAAGTVPSSAAAIAASSMAPAVSAAGSVTATPDAAAGIMSTATTTVMETLYAMTVPAAMMPSGMTVITAVLSVPSSAVVAKRSDSGAAETWRMNGMELLAGCSAIALLLSQLLFL